MMFLIRFWRNLTKKDSVESAKYDIQFCLFLLTDFSAVFFMDPDPDFPDRIRIFMPIRIRTQESLDNLVISRESYVGLSI